MRGEVGKDALLLVVVAAVWIGIGWVARIWLKKREQAD